MNRIRPLIAGIIGIIAVMAIIAGMLLGYIGRALFNPAAFADRTAESLRHEGVARLIATRIADSLIEQDRDLIALRPILIDATQPVVSSSPFRAMIRRAARISHQTLLSESSKNISLTVADAGIILRSTFVNHPQLADKIPARFNTLLTSLNEAPGGSTIAKVLRLIRRLRLGTIAFLLAGIFLGIISVSLANKKRLAMLRLGISLAVAALLLWLSIQFGGNVLALFASDPLVGDALKGLWQSFLGGSLMWALVLGMVGVVLSAAVSSLFERVKITESANGISQWFRESEKSTVKRVLIISFLLSAGTFMVFFPSAAMTIIILMAGMLIFFIGLREFFQFALRSFPEIKRSAKNEKTQVHSARTTVIAALAIILIGLGSYILFRSDAITAVPNRIDACNGYKELCNRRLNEVVFAAAHNAMSAAEISGWMFPNHEREIQMQLQDGIRAFLIDTHYGTPVQDKVKTMLENEEIAKKKYEAALGKEGVEAAMRIRDRLIGSGEGKTAIYLCHGFCELGSSELLPVLRKMREFLISNPNEVIIIINQDEGVKPESIESAFQESGLIDFVYRGPVAPPWPTLREMIASDHRVVVFAENNSKGVEWYHQVFESMQETPYSFHDLKEFSCIPNRGGTSGSLFLLNHWIDSTPAPKPSNAQIVNSYDFLLQRAHECQKQRRLMPNLIAVDFYRTGNLLEVVKTLNGIKKESI